MSDDAKRDDAKPPQRSYLGSLLTLHDRLAWQGLAKLAGLGALVLMGRLLWVRADLWFPRLVDSPVALALLVCCALVATYAIVQDRLVSRVDQRTDQVHSLLQSELARVRDDMTALRAELSDTRNAEMDCRRQNAALSERLLRLETRT